MKVLKCYNCGSTKHNFYAEENGFNIVSCDKCGLLFVEDRPDDDKIKQAHKQGKHFGTEVLDVRERFNKGKITKYQRVLTDLLNGNLNKKTTWLDIGCGHGEFMLAVQKYSSGKVIIKGTEPNIYKQESARKRGLDVGYFDLESHEEKYDFISMLNVFSHIPNPPEFINTLKKLLTPHGEFILETGDTASLPAKDHPRPFNLPDHLSFASESILADILERLNFEILTIKKYPFMPLTLDRIIKECLKTILPQYKSRIHYYFTGIAQTDMFIRARLKKTASM